MPESARDLIAVLLGLVVLWFLFGALINQERFWGPHRSGQDRRQSRAGRPHGGRSLGR
jgi:hypothetical protein